MKAEQEIEGVGNERMGFLVRPMRPGDIAQVARVERECFPTGWTPTPFTQELQNKRASYLVACKAKDPWRAEQEARAWLSAEEAVEAKPFLSRLAQHVKRFLGPVRLPPPDFSYHLAGYVGLWFMTDEAHITAIGTREADRRKGIGELLLLASIEEGFRKGARVVTLEARVSNHAARELYFKYGFNKAGIRKGYYTDNREDALVMTTDNLSSPVYRQRLELLRQEHARRWGESVRFLG